MHIEFSTEPIGPQALKIVSGYTQFALYIPQGLEEITLKSLATSCRTSDALLYYGAIFKTKSPRTSWAIVTYDKMFISTGQGDEGAKNKSKK